MCKCTPEIRTPFCGKSSCTYSEEAKYSSEFDYQTTKLRTILAVLKTLYEIEIEDFNGEIIISKNGKKDATIKIESEYYDKRTTKKF